MKKVPQPTRSMVGHQHRLAAEPVAEMAEERSAERPREEPDGEGA